MIAARLAAAKRVMPSMMILLLFLQKRNLVNTANEAQARMPFRSKQQPVLLQTRIRMEAALREVVAKS